MKRYSTAIVLGLIILGLILARGENFARASGPNDCRPVIAIFARGSGQSLQADDATNFFKQLDNRLGKDNVLEIELGGYKYGDSQYPAVSVDPWAHTVTDLVAGISRGYSGKYGDSVREGMSELIYRVVDLHYDCPNSKIVLGGYSQGAQVIGQALQAISTSKDIAEQIEFAALFGDPKLNLPEGRGFNPPACRKEQLSSWRRVVPDCDTDNGSLGARDPYIPDNMKNKVGLWCNDDDFVCGSTKAPWTVSGHGKYHEPDGPIDQAVLEIANRLQDDIALQGVSLVPDMFKIPSGHPDVMLVLENSNENMPAWYNFVIPTTFAIADQVTERGGRVGLQTFNGCAKKGRTYSTPLSDNPGLLEDTARSAWHMKPECDLSEDLIRTLTQIKDSPDWKVNRNKMIIVIPKVPFSAQGIAATTILNTQTDLRLYSVEPDETDGSYGNLQIGSHKNTPIRVSDFHAALVENTTNPQVIADLRNPNITTLSGTTVSFDASNSLVYDDTISRYEWDFDGNGTIDRTTTEPKTSYAYSSAFNGEMRLRVVTASGLSDSVTRKVLIQSENQFKHPAKAPVNLKLTKLSSSSVRLSWEPGDDTAIAWLIKIDDFPVGYTKKDQHYVNIKDISLDKLHTFSVEGVVDDDTGGEAAMISTKILDTATGTIKKDSKQKESEDANKQAAKILGEALKRDENQSLNPAAKAVAKLNPTAKSFLRGSLIFIVIGSISAAGILGWLLYKRRKTLF